MPYTGREKALCVLEYALSVEQDCAACICKGVLKAVTNSNPDLHMTQKIIKEGCLCRRKGSGRQKTLEETVERVREKSRKAERNH